MSKVKFKKINSGHTWPVSHPSDTSASIIITLLVSCVWEKKIIYLLLNITRIFSSFYISMLLACTNDIDWHILNTNKMLNVRHILWLHCRSWCTVATMAASILCLVGLQHYSISRWRDGRIVPRRASVPAHHSRMYRVFQKGWSSNTRKATILKVVLDRWDNLWACILSASLGRIH